MNSWFCENSSYNIFPLQTSEMSENLTFLWSEPLECSTPPALLLYYLFPKGFKFFKAMWIYSEFSEGNRYNSGYFKQKWIQFRGLGVYRTVVRARGIQNSNSCDPEIIKLVPHLLSPQVPLEPIRLVIGHWNEDSRGWNASKHSCFNHIAASHI